MIRATQNRRRDEQLLDLLLDRGSLVLNRLPPIHLAAFSSVLLLAGCGGSANEIVSVSEEKPTGPAVSCAFPGGFQHVPSNASHLNQFGGILDGWDPSVLFDEEEGIYKMWHTLWVKPTLGIAYAESTDGNTWTVARPKAARQVMLPTPGDWDRAGLETVSVIKEGGRYKMWYLGYPCYRPEGELGRQKCIGYAESDDGKEWVKYPTPVLQPEYPWEQPFQRKITEGGQVFYAWEGGLQEPTVIFDEETGLYSMWYEAYSRKTIEGTPVGLHRIGFATSTDGKEWVKNPVPVFEPGLLAGSQAQPWEDQTFVGHTNVVEDPDGLGYHLFYSTRWAIGHAFSDDGLLFVRNPDNPMVAFQPTPGGGYTMFGGPSVRIPTPGVFDMFLMRTPPGSTGYGKQGMNFGRAIGGCPPTA
jgi:hypothetical protein